MMAGRGRKPTAYEILGVHSRAPGELVSAAYWLTIDEIQTQREAGQPVDGELHMVTQAYESIATPDARDRYDSSLPDAGPALTERLSRKRGRAASMDYYEVMGLHETAPAELVREAYHVMRSVYQRVPMDDRQRIKVVSLLMKARETLANTDKRARYDAGRAELAQRAAAGRSRPSLAERLAAAARTLFPRADQGAASAPQWTLFARLTNYLEISQPTRGARQSRD